VNEFQDLLVDRRMNNTKQNNQRQSGEPVAVAAVNR